MSGGLNLYRRVVVDSVQRWHLRQQGHEHVVEVARGTLTCEATWWQDGARRATRKTSDETIVLTAHDDGAAIRVKLTKLRAARRVTRHGSQTEARTGLSGTDLEPEVGSKAAKRADWIGRHPHLHTARQTALGASGVLVPMLLVWLLTLVPWPAIDVAWPDLPSIPWPDVDLPSIPWPDLDLPAFPALPSLPAWVEPARKFVVPVVIAFFIARGEVKRRRRAEAARGLEEQARPASASAGADADDLTDQDSR